MLLGLASTICRGPARIRTRRAECYEPSFLDTCCGCLPGLGSRKYVNMAEMEWQEPVSAPLTAPAAAAATGGGGPGGGNAFDVSGRATPPGSSRAVVEAQWMCAMELTGRGVRGELEVELEVVDYGRVCLPLQAKVYAMGDSSAKHGVSLHAVEYLLYKHSITGNIKVLTTQYQR
ncbi:hypothetical protein Rsub_11637 [Raphidocelis subcapitata]|uniref:Uncharacterized protein n=1 Tax=Raphidocelis subcapitata TaxID=307507 RepID=A0A2V0PJJ4_9CHLO|nr:hypothetical protein Rsub_11637 [Raphidocelis subcapitata]|eukprot:GBF99192.1 hypothetical protein Rsub_11637 [Raphidocelis subcapitata]